MKKKLAYIIVLLLAVTVGYGGAGINYMIYCCSQCQELGPEVVSGNECCEMHHHEHLTQPAHEESTMYCSHDIACEMGRLSFDWNTSGINHLVLQPMVLNLNLFANTLSLLPLPIIKKFIHNWIFYPPLSDPRQYLSLLTVLLI